jgi:hypothetical protein
MEQAMQKARFVVFVGCWAALACGCAAGRAPAPPPECDQACKDGVALRSLRETMRYAYNFAIQAKPVGTQDQTVPCVPSGNVHIQGDGQSNAMLGTTTVNLTYAFASCMTFSKNTAPERNYTMTLNGVVTQRGTLAMGGATTALVLAGMGIGLSGTVYDPSVAYDEVDCVLDTKQDANNVTGTLCGRPVGVSGF